MQLDLAAQALLTILQHLPYILYLWGFLSSFPGYQAYLSDFDSLATGF
jgi:hypothetical protein